MTYLSIAPEGLREAFITGGLSPIGRPVDDVYAATYGAARREEPRYFARYPDDRARVRDILRRLDDEEVGCPTATGSPRGGSASSGCGWATAPASSTSTTCSSCRSGRRRSCTTSRDGACASARNPIYATLHESSYADGVADPLVGGAPAARRGRGEGYFTAEHVFPWMWEDYGGAAVAPRRRDLLAEHPWPRLYDADQLAATRSRSRRRSTSTTCTSSASSRRRPRARSAACGRG